MPRRTPARRSMSTRWARAGRRPNCTSPSSRICRRRGRAPAACITSPSARRTTRVRCLGAAAPTRCGIPNSGKVDRFYFRSLYFREPNGILFEIATDGPGFATDEPIDTLGESLALPPFLEPRRAEIEAGLKPIG